MVAQLFWIDLAQPHKKNSERAVQCTCVLVHGRGTDYGGVKTIWSDAPSVPWTPLYMAAYYNVELPPFP